MSGDFFGQTSRFHGNKKWPPNDNMYIGHLEKNNTLEIKQTWTCGLDCCVLLDSLYNLYTKLFLFLIFVFYIELFFST